MCINTRCSSPTDSAKKRMMGKQKHVVVDEDELYVNHLWYLSILTAYRDEGHELSAEDIKAKLTEAKKDRQKRYAVYNLYIVLSLLTPCSARTLRNSLVRTVKYLT